MSVYEIITDRIVSLLKAGTVPWRKPWAAGSAAPRSLVSGKPYRGINVFLLQNLGFPSPYFLTFKQALQRGGSVRKGEKGCPVVFWKWVDASELRDEEDEAQPTQGRVSLLRFFTVFNSSQCDGIQVPEGVAIATAFAPLEACERVVAGMQRPPAIEHGYSSAFYVPSLDVVRLPKPEAFRTPQDYYATLFHEIGHASGHPSRLARKEITDARMFGDHAYSREELCAEMTAAFLCGHTGIDTTTLDSSASYIASWLDKLQHDHRLVVTAAAQAQRAADFILGAAGALATEQEAA